MKVFNTLAQLQLASILTGTPVRVLDPALIDGVVVDATGDFLSEGFPLPSGNVFVPKMDDQEALTGRKSTVGVVGATIAPFSKDATGTWQVDLAGKTSTFFHLGQLWWPDDEATESFTVVSIGTPVGDRLDVQVRDGSGALTYRPYSRFAGLSQDVPEQQLPTLQPVQLGDGTKTTFDAPHADSSPATSFLVTVDGVVQIPVDSYTTAPGQISFTEAPPAGAQVSVTFYRPVSPGELPGTDVSEAVVVSTGSITPRTAAARFGDVVNVRDFGAVGDGVTDDTAAIQAAIDSTKLGDIVRFPSSVGLFYRISSTLNISKTGIKLQGDRFSWIAPTDNFVGDSLVSISGQGNWGIEIDVILKGRKPDTTDIQYGLRLDNTQIVKISPHCHFEQFSSNGIYVTGIDNLVIDCDFEQIGGAAIKLGALCTRVRCKGVSVTGGGGFIDCADLTSGSDVTLDNPYYYHGAGGFGRLIYTTINNGVVRDCQTVTSGPTVLLGDYGVLNGCHFVDTEGNMTQALRIDSSVGTSYTNITTNNPDLILRSDNASDDAYNPFTPAKFFRRATSSSNTYIDYVSASDTLRITTSGSGHIRFIQDGFVKLVVSNESTGTRDVVLADNTRLVWDMTQRVFLETSTTSGIEFGHIVIAVKTGGVTCFLVDQAYQDTADNWSKNCLFLHDDRNS